MILNATLCDYIRLTTFDPEDYKIMLGVFKTMASRDETEDFNVMQYGGRSYAHGFLGTGQQKRGQHYMMYFSGAESAIAYHTLLTSAWRDVRCTRIDAQMTIPLPTGYQSLKLFNRLNGAVPYGRTVTVYKSGDGMDTVYIGKRTTKNGRVTRIYVKEYVGGLGLRFETEYKGEHAAQNWEYLRQGGTLESLLVTEIESLGNIDFSPLATFYALIKGFYPAPKPVAVETSNNTLDWLLNTCDPVLRRMLQDHDHGSKVRHWLELLLDYSKQK